MPPPPISTTTTSRIHSPSSTLPRRFSNPRPLHFSTSITSPFLGIHNTTTLRPISKRAIQAASSSSGESITGSQNNNLNDDFSLNGLLAAAELVCLVPPAMCSMICLIGVALPNVAGKRLQASLSSRWFIGQYVMLVATVVIGSLLRSRHGRLFDRVNGRVESVDLVRRIEKVDDDLRSSATIVMALSRKLEKLGIGFRVTRRALKEPITETAALAQKNSEATEVLAMQEDVLEKELGEIQNVLLAMQEQQQKQLELILAIGEAGRLIENKPKVPEQGDLETSSSVEDISKVKELKVHSRTIARENNTP